MSQGSSRAEKVRAIQLAAMGRFQGDTRVIGEDVSLEELAHMFAEVLAKATYATYDAGYSDGYVEGHKRGYEIGSQGAGTEYAARDRRVNNEFPKMAPEDAIRNAGLAKGGTPPA